MKRQKFVALFPFVLLLGGCVTMAAPARPRPTQSPHHRPAGFWTNEKAVVQVLHIYNQAVADPNGKTVTQQWTALGTGGVVVEKNGLVLTNNHVIEKQPDQLPAPAPDVYLVCRVVEGVRNCNKAEVIATDPANDLAQLHTDQHFSHAVEFVDDSELLPGDEVYFWGNVFSLLPPSPFFGRYLGRVGPPYFTGTKDGRFSKDGNLLPLLFMDMTVVNGSSGSPVFDELGRGIGLAFAYHVPTLIGGPRPLGIIIPSSTVIKFLKENPWPRPEK